MAYVLGFFSADGYITVNRRGGQFWCIQITDRNLLEKIKKIIGSGHKISIRFPRKSTERKSYRLQIGSVEMCNDLRSLGFREKKTLNLSVPNVPEKYFSSFVRGYFDGDGNVWTGYVHRKRKSQYLSIQTVFTSCSKNFLETLRTRLEKYAVNKGVLRKDVSGNYYRLTYSINGSIKLKDFMYNHGVETSNMIFLKRKKNIFDRYLTMRL